MFVLTHLTFPPVTSSWFPFSILSSCFSTYVYTDVEVQLENTSITIYEEEEVVEVCVIVSTEKDKDCPVEFDIAITLSTGNDSAGAVM